jgi:2-polyprenyl-3-methyl-5-hydroxy-6-metoxy-1,4-benzoquinol methylase
MSSDSAEFTRPTPDETQRENRRWWTANPMAYDWHHEIDVPEFSRQWFDEIDARFLHGARLFATDRHPFDRLIPYGEIAGARVLEIGCGMGLHTELMVRAGADVTAVDISPTSIQATTRRLELKGLEANLVEADATALPFRNGTYDFVWAWGVIHHSSHTARIVREIARVLATRGSTRVMVYNRNGMYARVVFVRDFLMKSRFRRLSFDDVLSEASDGFSARYYVRDQFEDLFRAFFREASSEICGQESDVLPLPRRLRARLQVIIGESYMRAAQAKRGNFLFVRADGPI